MTACCQAEDLLRMNEGIQPQDRVTELIEQQTAISHAG
jgi:hypothetical protein